MSKRYSTALSWCPAAGDKVPPVGLERDRHFVCPGFARSGGLLAGGVLGVTELVFDSS